MQESNLRLFPANLLVSKLNYSFYYSLQFRSGLGNSPRHDPRIMDCQNLQHSWCSEEHVTITQKYNSHQSHPDPVIANPNRVDQSDCRLDGITNFSTGFVKIQTQLFLTDEIPPLPSDNKSCQQPGSPTVLSANHSAYRLKRFLAFIRRIKART